MMRSRVRIFLSTLCTYASTHDAWYDVVFNVSCDDTFNVSIPYRNDTQRKDEM